MAIMSHWLGYSSASLPLFTWFSHLQQLMVQQLLLVLLLSCCWPLAWASTVIHVLNASLSLSPTQTGVISRELMRNNTMLQRKYRLFSFLTNTSVPTFFRQCFYQVCSSLLPVFHIRLQSFLFFSPGWCRSFSLPASFSYCELHSAKISCSLRLQHYNINGGETTHGQNASVKLNFVHSWHSKGKLESEMQNFGVRWILFSVSLEVLVQKHYTYRLKGCKEKRNTAHKGQHATKSFYWN